MEVLIIDKKKVLQSYDMLEAMMALKGAFLDHFNGDTTMNERQILAPEGNYDGLQFLTMSAVAKSTGTISMKLSSIASRNKDKGIPMFHSILVVVDKVTGEPRAFVDGYSITTIRTGAMSGLVTDLLAKKDASELAIIGCGEQAKAQVEAICLVRRIDKITLHSRNTESALSVKKWIEQRKSLSAEVYISESVGEAVQGADVISTCTSTASDEPLVHPGMVKKDCHINAIGGISELALEISPELLKGSLVVVEDYDAALNEAGEIIVGLKNNCISKKDLITIGELLANKESNGYEKSITIFKSVGVAIQDSAVADSIYNFVRQTANPYYITF